MYIIIIIITNNGIRPLSWIPENVSKNGCLYNRAFKNFWASSRSPWQPATDSWGSTNHSLKTLALVKSQCNYHHSCIGGYMPDKGIRREHNSTSLCSRLPVHLNKQLTVHVAGYGAGYQYNHDVDATDQTYLPDELLGTSFFRSSSQKPSTSWNCVVSCMASTFHAAIFYLRMITVFMYRYCLSSAFICYSYRLQCHFNNVCNT